MNTDLDLKKILKLEYGLVVLLFLLAFIFDFYPKLCDIVIVGRRINAINQEARSLSQSEKDKIRKELEEEERTLESGFRAIQKIAGEITTKVVDSKNIPAVTLMMESLATQSGIELSSIKPLNPEIKGQYEFLPIALEFQTEYLQLVKFLSALEDSQFQISLQDLSVKENPGAFPKLDIRLTASVLFTASKESPPTEKK